MRGQVAYEFLFTMFFLTLAFTLWVVFSASAQEQFITDRQVMLVNDLGYQLQEDLYSAYEMGDGFSRTIHLPPSIESRDYVVDHFFSDKNHYLYVYDGVYGAEFVVPAIDSTDNVFQTGENVIRLEGGVIYVNP